MVRFNTLLLIAVTVLMTSCSSSTTEEDELYKSVSSTAQEVTVSDIEKEVLDVVNEYRVSIGLNALKFSQVAYSYANAHNTYMISEGQISHDNFDIRASKLSVDAKADYVSENLGMDFTNAEDILEAWKNSPIHKKVMEGNFEYTAVSVTADENGVLYFTQLFFL
ncbi:CAP domain-containing protein [Zobellia galactanivorans]|uniref:SCP-like extracellular protein n=1 Tax=Zobellia galactanivorans (strain DSM 12802 / CCUG 47099 / CIP 106680 / NCIMB 13871 / Dsij) TaxID=63186 RepID=G0LBH3_ZOBGA|nr:MULTISPECIES: CAP domain-containing protein [Zobellia]MBU3026462.1 CAP domain-containing protein [Zobellia galactanivorans]MDO6810001.1 CAP domain-containing protein [Zobellia galactanivorans]OWW27054.1 serine protease [Zobellia sp. OII3]CAZ96126.1 SCP-like extracellular protein [Zobellia galactanivorans]